MIDLDKLLVLLKPDYCPPEFDCNECIIHFYIQNKLMHDFDDITCYEIAQHIALDKKLEIL